MIFSKGGFVSVPVVLAGKHNKVPTIIHESDMTPGLANKIAIPSATKVCCNFPETLEHLPKDKAVLTGSPIRQELLSGNRIAAMDLCHFSADKPVILVIGGSLGSVAVNNAVRLALPIRQELLSGNRIAAMDLCHFSADKPVILVIGGSLGSVAVNNAVRLALPELLEHFQIVHLCGKGKVDDSLTSMKGYTQFEYIKDELRDIFALADIVISRAGANAICELLALRKPNLLIPLSANASRGDQKDELRDIFALADIVISRAGANAICELLALRKPNLLIPLSANASRGDQILNARSFERQGFSMVLEEEELTKESLLEAVRKLYNDRSRFMDAMRDSNQQNSIDTIIDLIENSRR